MTSLSSKLSHSVFHIWNDVVRINELPPIRVLRFRLDISGSLYQIILRYAKRR